MTYEITDLACRRGDLTVLSGVSFVLPRGEAMILRGSNGSGKTTLLRCLAGLTPPVAGRMSFSADEVAYAAHADGLKAQMSVHESLEFWASIYGSPDTGVAIDGFALAALSTRLVGTLSAGQKRRLSLARMMLTGRPIWALDEPTVSLDQDAVMLFAAAVRRHLEGGGSAIIATHIDLGLPDARVLDVGQFRAAPGAALDPFLDEAML